MVLQTTPHHSAVPYTCNDNVAGGDAEENAWRFGNACVVQLTLICTEMWFGTLKIFIRIFWSIDQVEVSFIKMFSLRSD